MQGLADRIKTLRQARGVTVEQAAATSGLTVSMWYKIESGDRKPSVQTLERVAQALKCSVADLFVPKDCTKSANQHAAAAEA